MLNDSPAPCDSVEGARHIITHMGVRNLCIVQAWDAETWLAVRRPDRDLRLNNLVLRLRCAFQWNVRVTVSTHNRILLSMNSLHCIADGTGGVQFGARFALPKHGKVGTEVHGYPGRIALVGTFHKLVILSCSDNQFTSLHFHNDSITFRNTVQEFFFGVG